MTQIHIPSTSTSADLERLDSPYIESKIISHIHKSLVKEN